MKKNYKAVSLFVMALTCSAFMFAQEEEKEDQLVLPEVTTTVSGDSLSAGREAIPDFSDVIIETNDSTKILPVLPGVEMYDVPEEPVADLGFAQDSQVYSEGLIGGGYPGYFIGDFSIYQSSGDEPFLLRFSQLTENGYGRHAASEGYFDSDTNLLGSKTIVFNSIQLDLSGSYSTSTVGFQSLSDSFYSMTQQNVETSDKFNWSLPLGFSVAVGTDLGWYSRYSGVNKGAVYTAQEAEGSVIFASPSLYAGWKNEYVDLGLSADYELETFTKEMDAATAGCWVINRGQFLFNFEWGYEKLSAGFNAGVVVGNEIGKVLPVMPLGLAFFKGEWEVPYAPATIRVYAQGGLDSYLMNYADLEQSSRYATVWYLPSETSDWDGELSVSVPVVSFLTTDAEVVFRKTAFGNGVWEPTYNSLPNKGMYTFAANDRTLVDSKLALNFCYGIFNVKLDWAAHWLHIPSSENQFSIGLSFNADSEDGVWGAELTFREALGDGADYVPVVNIGGYYRLRESIRLAFQVEDTAKLLTGKDRTYCNSVYSQRAGSATLLIKFFF